MAIQSILEMTRSFHPVGQGAFYSEVFKNGDEVKFSVVYDCGTETGKTAFKKCGGLDLSAQVSAFANRLNQPESQLDYLFISHLHSDHINGLKKLTDCCHPKHIVLPLLPADVILVQRIRNFLEDGENARAIDDTIKGFYLGESKPEIIGIMPEGDWEGKNVEFYPRHCSDRRKGADPLPIETDDEIIWRYRPFNSLDCNDERAKAFIKYIHDYYPEMLNAYQDDLIVDAVLAKIRELKKAYHHFIGRNDNLYTLVVESEPHENVRITEILKNKELESKLIHARAKCVYFGDYDPQSDSWNRFAKTINYDSVGSIQVPHHGSSKNWLNEMLSGCKKICIISAGSSNQYHHPSAWLVEGIRSRKSVARVVSEDPKTRVDNKFAIRWTSLSKQTVI